MVGMARPQRIEYEGAIYHVTARGNDRRTIFEDVADREHFLRVLREGVGQYETRLYLYCLMTNHLHLLVETPRANLGRFMHRLLTAYTVYFNRRHGRHGHVMQGRYGAWLVERDEYLLRLSRYIHLNPVFTASARRSPADERIAMLRQYPWSSYRSYIGKDRPGDFVDYEPVLALVEPYRARRRSSYRRFVEAGIENVDAAFIEAKGQSPLCIGSDTFRDRIVAVYRDLLAGRSRPEDIAFRRMGRRHETNAILGVVCEQLEIDRQTLLRRRRDCWHRAIAAKVLCDCAGLTQREVAQVLGVRCSACVSRQLQRLANELKHNPPLRNQVAQITTRLQKAAMDLKA